MTEMYLQRKEYESMTNKRKKRVSHEVKVSRGDVEASELYYKEVIQGICSAGGCREEC